MKIIDQFPITNKGEEEHKTKIEKELSVDNINFNSNDYNLNNNSKSLVSKGYNGNHSFEGSPIEVIDNKSKYMEDYMIDVEIEKNSKNLLLNCSQKNRYLFDNLDNEIYMDQENQTQRVDE